MSIERLSQVLVAPHVSEKAALLADGSNQHVFKVLTDAKKEDIKNAVEQMFQVKVATVRTVNVNGKQKRFGRTMGKRKDWKKAYVRLEQGHDIDLSGME
jgi:large subunit ribosomal protein L23